jgi:hypothetical protein
MKQAELAPVKARKRGHACKSSPCTRWPTVSGAGAANTARSQFARTFEDVLSGRFGGRWSVEWNRGEDAS